MPDSQIHLVNTATEQSLSAAPKGTVLSSSADLGWQGITVELHHLPPVEYPEHYVQGHRLAVVHQGKPITYEWFISWSLEKQANTPWNFLFAISWRYKCSTLV